MTDRVVIVGAGHNGLACAFYLARAGLAVQVIEARPTVGGACVTEELIPGYRFSTCANVVCWLRPEVARDMRLAERGVEFSVRGPPVYECFDVYSRILPDGGTFTWWRDPQRMEREIARFSAADARAWPAWQEYWRKAGEVIGPFLLQPPPDLADLLERAEAIGAGGIFREVLTTPVAHLADRFFESEVMRGHATSPHDLGSVYDTGTGLAAALAQAVSGYNPEGLPLPRGFVRGGMGRITQAMAEACRELGVGIRTGSPVEEILVEDGRAAGVRLRGGEEVEAGTVVSNADPKRTFLTLLAPRHLPPALLQRVQALRADVAPLKLHCALDGLPEFPAFAAGRTGRPPAADPLLPFRGGLRLCPDREYYESAWEDALHGRLPRAPYMDMMTPSLADDSLAPPGRHTVSFWILFAPVRLREGTWPQKREEMADRLISIIAGYAPDFRRRLVDRLLLTPHDLEERMLLTGGNIHHVDIHPSQMLWQRPLPELARYGTPIRGLYLCGAGQHPYGEVTGAPGHNAAARILGDREGGPGGRRPGERKPSGRARRRPRGGNHR